MAENTNRNVFGFHGIAGVLISIVGLLIILVALITLAIDKQRIGVTKPYNPAPIRDVNNLKMISVENKQFAFQPKKDK